MAKARAVRVKKKEAAPRLTRRQIDAANLKYYGPEPEPKKNSVLTGISLTRVLNWYSIVEDYDSAREYLLEYTSSDKNLHKRVKNLPHINTTYGWIARLLSRGANIDSDVVGRFKEYLNSIPAVESKAPVANKTDATPKDRISEFLPDFEYAVDNFQEEEFSAYNYLTSNNVPQIYAKRIQEYYEPLLEEFKVLLTRKDKDLNEAYSSYSSNWIKAKHMFIKTIIDDIDRFLNNQKKTRAPRKKKTPTADRLLKNFKYMANHDQMKLVSIAPENIIGAQALFTFNTKNNVFSVFIASGIDGLSVNRTAISGYNPELSKSKRVGRRTQEVLDRFMNGNKTTQKKILDSVTTDYIENFTDRLNEHTILLKVHK